MFDTKTGLLAAYLALAAVVLATPALMTLLGPTRSRATVSGWIPVLGGGALAGTCLLWSARGLPETFMSPAILVLACLLVPRKGSSLSATLGNGIGAGLFSTVTWWQLSPTLGPLNAVIFAAILIAALNIASDSTADRRLSPKAALSMLTGLGLAAMLLTGAFTSPQAYWALWHHWSAYIAPVQAVSAGGVPFLDFPVQYGMGPTLLIALFGAGDAWRGMYLAAGLANLAYLLLMGGCIIHLSRDISLGRAWLSLGAMAAAVLLWSGYPPDLIGPIATPSVGGLLFGLLAALVLHVIRIEAGRAQSFAFGHLLWTVSIAWSPEAGFFSSIVWWPWLALRAIGPADRLVSIIQIICLTALRFLVATAVVIGFWILIFRIGFGELPSLDGYLIFVRNPPGLLIPNRLGPIWLVLCTIVLSSLSLAYTDDRGRREGLVCQAALIGAGSYYLGRSHDNNLLNLFPFVVLALMSIMRCQPMKLAQGFAVMTLSGMLAWTSIFGYASWHQAWTSGQAARIGPSELLDNMRLATPRSQTLLDRAMTGIPVSATAGAVAGLEMIRERREGSPVFLSAARVTIRDVPGPVWTGMDSLAAYATLPPEAVRNFIRQGARRWKRPGWILEDQSDKGPWRDYFLDAYDLSETLHFNGFTAYRLTPR